MVRDLIICATLLALAITAAGHAQKSTDHVVLSLKREYGLAVYTQCCSEGNVAVLVTSGNPTFEANGARRDLLNRLHVLEEQLRKAAPLPK